MRSPIVTSLLLALALPAQEAPPKLTQIGEFGMKGPDDKVVKVVTKELGEYLKLMRQIGTQQSDLDFHFGNLLAQDSWRLRVYQVGKTPGTHVVHLDYDQAIDWVEFFKPLDPVLMAGPVKAWKCRIGRFAAVPRPDGGKRLNFWHGEGARPAALDITKYHDVKARKLPTALLKRLSQMPLFGVFDFRSQMPPENLKGVQVMFGPRIGVMGFGITTTGTRPVAELYTGMAPGQGMLGSYLAANPTPARLLGALGEQPNILWALNIGEQFKRTMATFAPTLKEQGLDQETIALITGLMESWTGELCFALSHADLPRGELGPADMQPTIDKVQTSIRGTVRFACEEGTAEELIADLAKIFARLEGKTPFSVTEKDGVLELVDENAPTRLVVGGKDDRVVVGIGATVELARKKLQAALAPQSEIAPPKLLAASHAPWKLWISRETLRSTTIPYRAMGSTAPEEIQEMLQWLVDAMENRLFAGPSLISVDWTRRLGLRLRWQF